MKATGFCEDVDPSCPKHFEKECTRKADITLFRVDQVDCTGTNFCNPCSEDGLKSGLFSTEKSTYAKINRDCREGN